MNDISQKLADSLEQLQQLQESGLAEYIESGY